MASQRLISEALTGEEVEKLKPREKRWKEIVDLHKETVKAMKGKSMSAIGIECDMTERQVKRMLALIRKEEKAAGGDT